LGNQPSDGYVARPSRATDLISDDADFRAQLLSEHGFDKVTFAVGAINPAGAEDEVAIAVLPNRHQRVWIDRRHLAD